MKNPVWPIPLLSADENPGKAINLEQSVTTRFVKIQKKRKMKRDDNITMEKETFDIRSSNFIISRIFSKKRMKQLINTHLFEILDKEKDMNLPQSGWTSNKVIFIDINLFKVNLLP